jgi:hypothetical protein
MNSPIAPALNTNAVRDCSIIFTTKEFAPKIRLRPGQLMGES